MYLMYGKEIAVEFVVEMICAFVMCLVERFVLLWQIIYISSSETFLRKLKNVSIELSLNVFYLYIYALYNYIGKEKKRCKKIKI